MAKLKFFAIKHPNGAYEGMFLAADEASAREVAKKNNFRVDDNTVFEDVSVPITEADRVKTEIYTGGDE